VAKKVSHLPNYQLILLNTDEIFFSLNFSVHKTHVHYELVLNILCVT